MARRWRRHLGGAKRPSRGPSRRNGCDKRTLWGVPSLQKLWGGSEPPKLTTLSSSSASGAAAWNCSLPPELFRAGGTPHGQGPGSAWGCVRGGGVGLRRRAAAGAGSTSHVPLRFTPSGQGLSAPGPARRARPRPQLRVPGLPRGSRAEAAGPGRARSAAAGGTAAGRGAPSPRACAARPRLSGKEALERASPRPGARDWGRGAGGGAPGRSPERRRGSARWVRGAKEDGPLQPGAHAGLGRRRLRNAPASASARRSELGGRCSRRRLPGAAGQSRRAIPASRAGPGGGWRGGGGRAGERWGPGSGLAPPPRAQSAGIAQQLQ